MVVAIVLWLVFCRGIIVNQDVAVRTLETQGFSDIQVAGSAWFLVGFRGCDAHDATRFTMRAKNPLGTEVNVYVCTGAFFKGGTIRVP